MSTYPILPEDSQSNHSRVLQGRSTLFCPDSLFLPPPEHGMNSKAGIFRSLCDKDTVVQSDLKEEVGAGANEPHLSQEVTENSS